MAALVLAHSGCAAFFLGSDMTGQEIFWALCNLGEVSVQAERSLKVFSHDPYDNYGY